MTRFNGSQAFVTGGGRGIGADVARRLAADGANVWVCDIDLDASVLLAAEDLERSRSGSGGRG